MVKIIAKASILALSLVLVQTAHSAPVHDKHWSLMAGRIFPNLVALQAPGIPRNAIVESVLRARHQRIDACQHQPACVFTASMWNDQEITAISDYAERILREAASKAVDPDDGTKARVTRELRGLNDILKVYGLGGVPANPQIDGPIEPPGTAQFLVTADDGLLLSEAGVDDPSVVFDPSLATALALLDVNDRGEAVAFEPLDKAENSGALSRAQSVDWKTYKYTAVVIPGKGPDDSATSLSARGKLRIRLAAARFAEGIAPFIIVSGGAVHPKGTHYVEAVEMRNALIERYGVPADRIILEPYARYTITNLRNATRRLVAFGAPLDEDFLIVSDIDQIKSIVAPEFKAKCQDRLGYQPGAVDAQLSPYELTFKPSALSERLNPADPLDP